MAVKTLLATAGIVGLCLAAPSAVADVIFEDLFNRSNSSMVGGDWLELENDANDVAVVGNRLLLRDELSGYPDASATQIEIDATGFVGLGVEYSWSPLSASDSGDKLYVQWRLHGAADWTTLVWHDLGGNPPTFTEEYILLSATADSASIDLRFFTKVNDGDEGALVDYVRVTGAPAQRTTAPDRTVPEPAPVLLLAVGLAGLAFAHRGGGRAPAQRRA